MGCHLTDVDLLKAYLKYRCMCALKISRNGRAMLYSSPSDWDYLSYVSVNLGPDHTCSYVHVSHVLKSFFVL